MENKIDTLGKKAKAWTMFLLMIVLVATFALLGLAHGLLGQENPNLAAETVAVPFIDTHIEPSLIVALCIPLVCLVISVYYVIRQFNRIKCYQTSPWNFTSIINAPKSLYIRFIGAIMGICFSFGWALNILAFWEGGHSNVAKVLVHGAIAAFELFFLDINEDIFQTMEKHSPYFNNNHEARALIEGGIIITAVVSTICMFSLVVNIFLTRLLAWKHRLLVIATAKRNNQIYVFFGVGEKEQTLAKSILQRYEDKGDTNHLIVFVEPHDEDEENHNSWQSLLSLITIKNPIVSRINREKHCIYMVSEEVFSKADSDNLLISMGLPKLHRLIRKLGKVARKDSSVNPQLHFFVLSEERNQNVGDTRILCDYLLKRTELADIPKTVYCAARKDSVTAVIEDFYNSNVNAQNAHLTVRLIDEARMSVDVLKRKSESFPIKYVDLDLDNKPGTVLSPFHAMILGFGETGRDTFRYIYEFGAFVDGNKETIGRSPFICDIIDTKVEELKGTFVANSPKIKQIVDSGNDDSVKLEFHDFDVNTLDFYNHLLKNFDSLNYIIDKFRIFVRVHDRNTFTHIASISEFYNTQVAAESGVDNIIVTFGDIRDIYDYNVIVEDRFVKEGVTYDETYYKYYKRADDRIKVKKNELLFNMNINGAQEEDSFPKSKWEKGDKKKTLDLQNRNNAIHARSKLYFIDCYLKKLLSDKDIDVWKWFFSKFDVELDTIDRQRLYSPRFVSYSNADKIGKEFDGLMSNLAIMEHLRWNASHEILGFVEGNKKDYRHKTHLYLKPWDRLPEISEVNGVRLFDYLVVETTLYLKKKDLFAEIDKK